MRSVYGSAPGGRDRLIIGHEGLGEVVEGAAGSGFEPGDSVARQGDHADVVKPVEGELDRERREKEPNTFSVTSRRDSSNRSLTLFAQRTPSDGRRQKRGRRAVSADLGGWASTRGAVS